MSSPSDPTTRQEPPSQESLLAYVQGRAPPAVAAAIEAGAATDPTLMAELVLMRGLSEAGTSVAQPKGSELGWARLSRAVDVERAQRGNWLVQPRFAAWQMAAAAAAVVVLTLGVTSSLSIPSPWAATYEAAGGRQEVSFGARVTFATSASEAALRAALLDVGAEITSGPSALGVYTLSFSDEEARATGVERLREQKDIVETISGIE